jgi:hypothetical protein
LTNVARASQEELLEDYQDFLRVRKLATWDKDSRQARYVRKLGANSPATFEDGGLRERMTRTRLQAREQQRRGEG